MHLLTTAGDIDGVWICTYLQQLETLMECGFPDFPQDKGGKLYVQCNVIGKTS